MIKQEQRMETILEVNLLDTVRGEQDKYTNSESIQVLKDMATIYDVRISFICNCIDWKNRDYVNQTEEDICIYNIYSLKINYHCPMKDYESAFDSLLKRIIYIKDFCNEEEKSEA